MGQPLDIPLEHLLRELTPQVLGTVARRFRDFAAAEDAVQEALLAAATQWPDHGLPDNPRAWLTQVAFRRMTDQIRSESARRRREGEMALEASRAPQATPTINAAAVEDDTLVLLFMCCHPALSLSSAIALTLRVDHGGNRQSFSCARRDDGAADQSSQAKHQGLWHSLRTADKGRTCAAPAGGSTCALSHLQ